MKDIESYIREIPDFPKPGIQFKDITPLLQDPDAMLETVSRLIEMIGDVKIDKVVGIESRGFLFGTLLAQRLNAGFVPVRKPGKLPYKTYSEVYELEYGKDTLEIHQDAIKKGETVLLHDDVLATGGTARTACNLIKKMGGIIVQCNFLTELSYLNGRNKLRGYDVESLFIY
ncbi:adenine phosphoribosyltransferase [Antarcticibacterium arcticum]|uniref:Adenine phosphoribosyltransferase n=1 Tax=Antarcticibacterium arcticum TaxID=2585771 RepID=A0A5B8YKV3_9FLAO|nr:adenine phosphoribosyltransferase [Antarcticibacterium arcticum]QED37848.1 adenine phosphoribosyltransferase [Antarcticibacterium arcticum]